MLKRWEIILLTFGFLRGINLPIVFFIDDGYYLKPFTNPQ